MNIPPVLTGGKGVATDLSVVASYSTNSLLVFMDTTLLERVPASDESLQYKLLGGRLVNMGFSMRALRAAFPHDPRTLKRWGEATVCEEMDEAARLLRGRGAGARLTPPDGSAHQEAVPNAAPALSELPEDHRRRGAGLPRHEAFRRDAAQGVPGSRPGA